MLTQEDYVTFVTARMLKEIGFSESCRAYWIILNDIKDLRITDLYFTEADIKKDCRFHLIRLAPSLYEAQKYLRQKHNISVEIYRNASGYCWSLSKAVNGTFITDYNLKGPNDGGCWDDFEGALNDGIYNACKMIKEKKISQ